MNRVTLILFVYYSTYLVMCHQGHGSHGSKKTGGGGSLKHEDLGKLSSDIEYKSYYY